MSAFDSTKITTHGGSGLGGAAGTVYLKDKKDAYGTLIIDNGSQFSKYWSPIGLPGQVSVSITDTVLIRGSGTVAAPDHPGLTVTFQQSVMVAGNSRLESDSSLSFLHPLVASCHFGWHVDSGLFSN